MVRYFQKRQARCYRHSKERSNGSLFSVLFFHFRFLQNCSSEITLGLRSAGVPKTILKYHKRKPNLPSSGRQQRSISGRPKTFRPNEARNAPLPANETEFFHFDYSSEVSSWHSSSWPCRKGGESYSPTHARNEADIHHRNTMSELPELPEWAPFFFCLETVSLHPNAPLFARETKAAPTLSMHDAIWATSEECENSAGTTIHENHPGPI